MENKEDDIENLFRERFADDEAPLSPRVWQNIQNTLPEDKGPTRFTFSSNMLLWCISGILLLSAIAGCFILVNPKNKVASSITVQQEQNISAKKMDERTIVPAHDNKQSNTTNHRALFSDSIVNAHFDEQNHQVSNQPDSKKHHEDFHYSKVKTKTTDLKNDASNKESYFNAEHNYAAHLKNNRNTSLPTNESVSLGEPKNKKRNRSAIASNDNSTSNNLKNKSIHSTKEGTKNKLDSSSVANEKSQSDIDNALSQKMQKVNSTLVATDSFLTKTETTNYKSNTILSSEKNELGKQKANDSLLSSKDYSSGSLNESPITMTDSSITDYSPASITKNSDDSQNDNLKNTNLSSSTMTKHTVADASILKNNPTTDSLLFTSLAVSDNLIDSVALFLDSTQNKNKDSVLTETSTKQKKNKSAILNRFSFDLVASGSLTGASTKATATDSMTQSAVENKNKQDKNSWGYSAGIVVNYKLSNHFQASTGILYTTFSEEYHFNYSLKTVDYVYHDSTWQYVEKDSISRDIKAKDQYSFLSIPLQLSYTFLSKEKISLSATAGVRSNILLKGLTYLPNANNSDVLEVRSGFNSISLSYLFALEATYKLNEHAALLLQPTFVYGASSIHNKASGLSQKPYGLGLTLGLRITF